MTNMLISILLSIGISALATLVTYFTVLTLANIVERIAKHVKNKVIIKKGQKLLAEAMGVVKTDKEAHTLDQLRDLIGKEGVVEAEIKPDNTIDPKSVRILQSDQMDDQLSDLFEQNDGELVVKA